tara:strand:- start:210 stop:662 length:453 start_codon:yes stop_codon:yes gene_type:complete
MMRKVRLFYAMIYFIVLYLPIVLIIAFSFNDSVYIAFPLKAFTLRWYQAAMENQQLLSAFSNSMIIAVTTAILATFSGMLAAMATTRYRFRGRSLATVSLFVPLALPTVVTGVIIVDLHDDGARSVAGDRHFGASDDLHAVFLWRSGFPV